MPGCIFSFSKLPTRQLTIYHRAYLHLYFSKLPTRQLTVVFCANILMLLTLVTGYSYLTKIFGTCQNPVFTRPASKGKIFGYINH